MGILDSTNASFFKTLLSLKYFYTPKLKSQGRSGISQATFAITMKWIDTIWQISMKSKSYFENFYRCLPVEYMYR